MLRLNNHLKIGLIEPSQSLLQGTLRREELGESLIISH